MDGESPDSYVVHSIPIRRTITPIERAILRALADGARSADIARKTNCACSTVETRIRILFEKLGARSRCHLVAAAFRAGILTID